MSSSPRSVSSVDSADSYIGSGVADTLTTMTNASVDQSINNQGLEVEPSDAIISDAIMSCAIMSCAIICIVLLRVYVCIMCIIHTYIHTHTHSHTLTYVL